MKIAPSILSCDFVNLKKEIDSVVDYIDYLHIDVMDGMFVNNISFGIPIIKSIKKNYPDLFLDVHLMIENPLKYIEHFSSVGSDLITFHYESNSDVLKTILAIKQENKKVGISIKPQTSIDVLLPYLSEVDLVLIMSVEPGFGGQSFDESSIEKIKKLKEIKTSHNFNFEIEVDGGINNKTIDLVTSAGVEVVVSGSYIFDSNDKESTIDSLKLA